MSSIEDRRKTFEAKFKNDEDLQFRANSRAVKQLGFWAAEKLGMSGDDADCYAQSLVDIDFDEPGVANVFRKIKQDVSQQGKEVDDAEMQQVFNEKLAAAKISLMEMTTG